jgi:hypothetical protein
MTRGYKPPKEAALRAAAKKGGLRARLKTRPSRANFDDDELHRGVQIRPTPSLPRVRFLEAPELPPYDEWVKQ